MKRFFEALALWFLLFFFAALTFNGLGFLLTWLLDHPHSFYLRAAVLSLLLALPGAIWFRGGDK